MKIIHIADLHIQAARKLEYLEIFDLLLDQVEAITPAAVVIAGDVFDNKVTVKPDEIDAFCYLTKCIVDARCHLIIIPGNHDCNMNDANMSDLLTPIVKESLQDNAKYSSYVHFWPATGVYEALGIDWYVYSPIDRKLPEWRDSGRPRIALVHETVRSCEIQTGAIWEEETRLSVEQLERYDIVMLGDVHRMQFMRPHVAYSGSLVQQNIGESHLGHGFILWDVAQARGEFHEIANPTGVMLKMMFENDRPTNAFDAVERVKRCDVFYKNCSSKYVSTISEYVRNRWGIAPTRFREIDPAIDHRIADADESRTALEKWMSQQRLSPDQCARLRAADLRYKRTTATITGQPYQLLYLEWRNMLCYGADHTNHIDFSKFRPGDRVGIMGANRSGKSSILDVMCYTLHDVPLRGLVADIMNIDAAAFSCRAVVQSGNHVYDIVKSRDSHMHTKLRVTRDGVNVTQSSVPKTYEWLQSVVGRYTDFVNITCQLQDHPLFTSLAHRDQVAYIYNVLGLDAIPDLIKRVRADRLELRAEERRIPRPAGVPPNACPTRDVPEDVTAVIDRLNQRIGLKEYPAVPEAYSDDHDLTALKIACDRLRDWPARMGDVAEICDVSLEQRELQAIGPVESITILEQELAQLPEPLMGDLAKLTAQLLPGDDVADDPTVVGDLVEVVDKLSKLPTKELDCAEYERQLAALPTPVEGDVVELAREIRPIPTSTADRSRLAQELAKLPTAVKNDAVALARQLVPVKVVPEAALVDDSVESLVALCQPIVAPKPVAAAHVVNAVEEVQRLERLMAAPDIKFSEGCSSCHYNRGVMYSGKKAVLDAELARARAAVKYAEYLTAVENHKHNLAMHARLAGARYREYLAATRHNAQIEQQILAARAWDISEQLARADQLEQHRVEIVQHNAAVENRIAAARAWTVAQSLASARANNQQWARRADLERRRAILTSRWNRKIQYEIDQARAYDVTQRLERARRADAIQKHIAHVNGIARGHAERRLERAENAHDYREYCAQRDAREELAEIRAAVAWREHAAYAKRVEAVRVALQDLDLYLLALDPETGYPRLLIQQSLARLRSSVQETVALVTRDRVTIGDEFEIRINNISVSLASGFQKMITNLALRNAMLRLAEVPHQRATLILDEGLLGSCDTEHMHQVITQLLPAIGVRLFIITHHSELRASMTHAIVIAAARVNYGDARVATVADASTIERDEEFKCDLCDIAFKSRGLLARHVRSNKHIARM